MMRNDVSRRITPHVVRATDILLSAEKKFQVSLGTWSQGTEIGSSDVFIFIPMDSLTFNGSNDFLRYIRRAWQDADFFIEEDSVRKNYNYQKGITPSQFFRLHPIS